MRRLAVAAAMLVLAGCGRDEPEAPMTPETFIEVVTALREANRGEPSPEVFFERKKHILEEAGVTDSALVAFVRVHANDVALMAATWDSIAQRLRASDTIFETR